MFKALQSLIFLNGTGVQARFATRKTNIYERPRRSLATLSEFKKCRRLTALSDKKFCLRHLKNFALLTITLLFAFSISPAHAQCASPAGVEGEIIMNGDYNVPTFCDGTNWNAMVGGDPVTGGGDYVPNAVEFDGSSTYLETNTPPSGVSDGKTFTGSVWVNRATASDSDMVYTNDNGIRIQINSSGTLSFRAYNTSSTEILNASVSNAITSANSWHHILFSFDMANSGNNRIYLDDVQQSISYSINTDDIINFTTNDFSAGAYSSGGNPFDGFMTDLWFSYNNFIDLSIEANRRKFIDANGNPVYLGTDGSLPTGSAPDIFLSGDTANWHTNKGTGGGFTENGALTDAATSPYVPRTNVVPNGLVGHWRLDETSGTTAVDSGTLGNNGSYMGGLSPATHSETGKINAALNFENNNGHYVSAPDNATYQNLSTFTMAAWVKPYAFNNHMGIMEIEDLGRMWFNFNTNRFQFTAEAWSTDIGTWRLNDAAQLNQWTHVAVTYDYNDPVGTDPEIYINGVQTAHTGKAAPTGTYSAPGYAEVLIGNMTFSGLRNFNGVVDDARIYNRTLTPEEITEIYNARDGIRYNASHRKMEYFDGNSHVSMTPEWKNVDQGPTYTYLDKDALNCPTAGNTCDDNTIYLGLSPDGNVEMFMTDITHEGSGVTWNNNTTNYFVTGITNTQDGDGNTTSLIGLGDIGAPYNAANYCNDLTAEGHTDWYLPAEDEMSVIYNSGTPLGDVLTGGAQYWTSTENDISQAKTKAMNVAFFSNRNKNANNSVRCVRTGTAAQVTGSGGLVGHWKLDETSGTTIADSSGNGLVGTMLNDMDAANATQPGAVGRALHFDGLDDGITLNSPNILDDIELNNNGMTLSAWIYQSSNGSRRILQKGQFNIGVGEGDWYLIVSGNELDFVKGHATTNLRVSSTNVITNDTWHHVLMTWDGSPTAANVHMYVDGVETGYSLQQDGVGAKVSDDIQIMRIGTEGGSPEERKFHGKLDDVRIYDRILTQNEITALYTMGTPVGSSTALPQGCPNVGDMCDDGTVYAGLSPDGNVAMFVPTLDNQPISRLWNENVTHTNYSDTGATSNSAGETNTNTIVTIDADTTVAGFQVHRAAQYCYNLVLHGTDDWYLPAINELSTIYTNRTGNMNIDSALHWSSSQSSQNTAEAISFSDGVINQYSTKNTNRRVKCLRKGPAPRCANPYGVEGAMLYNTDNDVVQYCDGARWVAIGKYQ